VNRSFSIYVCQSCGSETRQYFGRCPNCSEWNSIVEEIASKAKQKKTNIKTVGNINSYKSKPISEDHCQTFNRINTGYEEFNRVLGGGIVPGSVTLVGGDPGIGKSTLLLKSANYMSSKNRVLYVTAEESAHQVNLRWKRVNKEKSELHLFAETDLDEIINEIINFSPKIVVIDSIQAINYENLSSAPGSVAQVRECSAALQRIAKENDIALLIVGHVTKEGSLAGPKVLEHLVDAVLTFEGDRYLSNRLLRAAKNRFGATNELGVFEMTGNGLEEVINPSELFLSRESAPGVATTVACEGSRPIAIDLQALTNPTTYASPRRTATGVENNRLHQILAVIEKHLGIALSRQDCYLAVAGGLTVDEPAADLCMAGAIFSSFKNAEFNKGIVFIGEVGLGGQLRQVKQVELRIQESIRLGFKTIVLPFNDQNKFAIYKKKIKIIELKNLREVFSQDILFKQNKL
tara:strand:+ start:36 stop:1421 length:1386 start_codon:yes stop_codon:yes gene_type:complete